MPDEMPISTIELIERIIRGEKLELPGGYVPSSPHTKLRNGLYSIDWMYGWEAPPMGSLNKFLPLPKICDQQDQGHTPRCVVFGTDWMESGNVFNNHVPAGQTVVFDKGWLWKACGGTSNGAQINWALDVLIKQGNVRKGDGTVRKADGIASYAWARAGHFVDDTRAALAAGKGCVIGTIVTDTFLQPTHNSRDEFWVYLGEDPRKWGQILGLHCMYLWGAFDDQQCFWLINSWSCDWPLPGRGMDPIRVPYWAWEYLGKTGNLEVAIPTDIEVPQPGVTVSIGGNAGTDNAKMVFGDKSVVSGADGNYTFSIAVGWNGSVMPSKDRYTFEPAKRDYTNVQNSMLAENYVAKPVVPPPPPPPPSTDNTIDVVVTVGGVKYQLTGGILKPVV